ncbi:MAG TPA: DUF4394 domain-containing protein [Solimonas sp.]|nr:DUF4394 domain-containing protein [Solimonas sp.]
MTHSKKLLCSMVGLTLAGTSMGVFAGPPGYALTSAQRLVRFEVNSGVVTETDLGAISGLGGADTALVGIDFRSADFKLYGLGNGGGVYRISINNGNTVLVNNLSVPLEGTGFAVDFNPAADRLRVISNTGQSLRHNLAGTTTDDGDVSYTLTLTPGTPATTILSAAYTNNNPNNLESGTTLFVLDATNDQVAIVSPPNGGAMVATGKFGLDVTGVHGFDIRAVPSGNGTTNAAYAALTVGGVKSVYSVDLLDGSITGLGDFTADVIDVAFKIAN